MKIAYIALKGMPLGGGIEKYTEELGSRLAGKGHEIVLYTMKHYGASNGKYRGMRIKTVPTIRNRNLEKITASFMASIWQCFENDFDIIHYHTVPSALFAFTPRLIGRKSVIQWHGVEWRRSKFSALPRLLIKHTENIVMRMPHMHTAVSYVQQKYIQETYNKKCRYIPTGVNPPTMLKPDDITKFGLKGDDYILFAARLVREKGAHYLIEAYNQIDTPLKLVIAGDAEYEEEYKQELRRLAGDNPNIIFPGFVTGSLLHEFFSNARFFVLPSEIEGLPIALLEAMSYGNCVLTSDIPENIEALNGLGYTFGTKNVSALAKQLDYLSKNKDATNRFKSEAKEHVLTNYSWDSIASSFEEFYMELLSNSDTGVVR